jgi:hypothetical protein
MLAVQKCNRREETLAWKMQESKEKVADMNTGRVGEKEKCSTEQVRRHFTKSACVFVSKLKQKHDHHGCIQLPESTHS